MGAYFRGVRAASRACTYFSSLLGIVSGKWLMSVAFMPAIWLCMYQPRHQRRVIHAILHSMHMPGDLRGPGRLLGPRPARQGLQAHAPSTAGALSFTVVLSILISVFSAFWAITGLVLTTYADFTEPILMSALSWGETGTQQVTLGLHHTQLLHLEPTGA